jgi:hypothetical protein
MKNCGDAEERRAKKICSVKADAAARGENKAAKLMLTRASRPFVLFVLGKAAKSHYKSK